MKGWGVEGEGKKSADVILVQSLSLLINTAEERKRINLSSNSKGQVSRPRGKERTARRRGARHVS